MRNLISIVSRRVKSFLFGEAHIYQNRRTGGWSQIGQDLFVSRALKNKRDGFYLEVGGFHPFQYSNSYYLETHLGFKGVSFEKDRERQIAFRAKRDNECCYANVLAMNVDNFLRERSAPTQIDYLSIDIEPNSATLEALKLFVSSSHRFTLITFEHNKERPKGRDRETWSDALEFLSGKGYKRVCSDVKLNGLSTEDWYVDVNMLGTGELDEAYLQNIESRSGNEYVSIV
jgi:hypothetical protein